VIIHETDIVGAIHELPPTKISYWVIKNVNSIKIIVRQNYSCKDTAK